MTDSQLHFPSLMRILRQEKGDIVTPCRVYWGSHGCQYELGHSGHHFCCCDCVNHPDPDSGCVGAHPYYSNRFWFGGEDAPLYHRFRRKLDRLFHRY